MRHCPTALALAASFLMPTGRALADSPAPKISPQADLRLRYEGNFSQPGAEDFHRGRMRLRLGAKLDLRDWLSASARLRTGNPDDPNNPHVDLTSNFDSFTLAFDTAYLQVTSPVGVEAVAGKFTHVAKSREVLWDADINPTGVAAAYKSKSVGVLASARPSAFFYVINNPSTGKAATALGGQVLGKFSLGDATLELASGALVLQSPESLANESPGNRRSPKLGTDGKPVAGEFVGFESDYRIVDTLVDVGFKLAGVPVVLGGDFFVNLGAADNDWGVQAGVDLGTLKAQGDWQLRYYYSDVRQDAVLSALAQDDYRLATNYTGHEAHAGLVVIPGLNLIGRAYVFKSRAGDNTATADINEGQWQARARIDLEARY
ncbi:MAG: putative porin [Deltaproteobacteria bacterium]|nr:putative porin [Deltaproteobacteria bacterium]